jgi:hypothetical protein
MTDLERFKIFCAQFLTAEDGRPLVIEPFQERITDRLLRRLP